MFHTLSGQTFLVDAEDIEKVAAYHWSVNGKGYVVTTYRNAGTKRQIRLHRLITDCPQDKVVDHINHDTADNRKRNLRVCTQFENMKNKSPHRNSKSGIKGVYPEYGKWRVIISCNRVQYHLGTYANIEDAIRVRQEAERKFFGEFANIQEVAI